jgi:simple sugar transport system ATP-binding protein
MSNGGLGQSSVDETTIAVPAQVPLYEARNISKNYGSVCALDGASVALNAGEVVGLVGDNGAGKSTLVKVLSGAHSADSGQMLFEGTEREWRSPHEAIAAGIETLYQDSGLATDLSISANVFLGREVFRTGLLGRLGFMDQRRMALAASAQLEAIGIAAPSTDRRVNQLSGGQRQAVAIGRAVAWARRVIILDEPTNHLGPRQSAEVLHVIRQARLKGLAVLMVSHTLPHVFEVSDRIVVLRLGRVIADEPASAFTADSLVKAITGFTRP